MAEILLIAISGGLSAAGFGVVAYCWLSRYTTPSDSEIQK